MAGEYNLRCIVLGCQAVCLTKGRWTPILLAEEGEDLGCLGLAGASIAQLILSITFALTKGLSLFLLLQKRRAKEHSEHLPNLILRQPQVQKLEESVFDEQKRTF